MTTTQAIRAATGQDPARLRAALACLGLLCAGAAALNVGLALDAAAVTAPGAALTASAVAVYVRALR